jgi:hypothetical protein
LVNQVNVTKGRVIYNDIEGLLIDADGEAGVVHSSGSSRRERRAVQSPGSSTSGNEIVRGAGKVGGRCLAQEEEPEIKYFYLNQNPEEVKILTSSNPTQRWAQVNYSEKESGSKGKSKLRRRIYLCILQYEEFSTL